MCVATDEVVTHREIYKFPPTQINDKWKIGKNKKADKTETVDILLLGAERKMGTRGMPPSNL